jgi:hypothetical protein
MSSVLRDVDTTTAICSMHEIVLLIQVLHQHHMLRCL